MQVRQLRWRTVDENDPWSYPKRTPALSTQTRPKRPAAGFIGLQLEDDMNNISLSKSQYMEGLRCPRLLWLELNRPDLAEPPDQLTRYLMEAGHRVEGIARKCFPDSILIGEGYSGSLDQYVTETNEAIKSEVPFIFEATFATDTLYCRPDVLQRRSNGRWGLCEFKMSMKDEHLDDVSFQACCLEACGYTVEKSYVIHLDGGYVRLGEIEPAKLFAAIDITKPVLERVQSVPTRVNKLIELIKEVVQPKVSLGPHCKVPALCPFYQYCHANIPEYSVYELPYGGKKIPVLLGKGIGRLADIPSCFPLSQLQARLVQSARLEQPVINSDAIRTFLQQLQYPLFFLDFESANPWLPPFDNCRPFERIPFQFSLHVQQTKGGILQHFEFLPDSAIDPRQRICEELVGLLGSSGSIIAWNMSFEIGVLAGLGRTFPQHSDKINGVIRRFIDLITPFRSGAYSDFRFHGSCSLKKILPILVPSMSYGNLAIGKGDDASLQFQKLIDGSMSIAEWEFIRHDLLDYCATDTLAMEEILHVLYKLI
jgi:hypothetical protein